MGYYGSKYVLDFFGNKFCSRYDYGHNKYVSDAKYNS